MFLYSRCPSFVNVFAFLAVCLLEICEQSVNNFVSFLVFSYFCPPYKNHLGLLSLADTQVFSTLAGICTETSGFGPLYVCGLIEQ